MKFLWFIIFSLLHNFVVAQQQHFILIESKSNTAFAIKCNNSIYNSDSKTYITIPQLDAGSYSLQLIIGTKKISDFNVEITNNDLGFELQQDKDNNYFLQDIISNSIISNTSKLNKEREVTIKQELPSSKPITEKNIITKIYHQQNEKGVNEIYIDGRDTISIFIPNTSIKEVKKTVAIADTTKVATMHSSNIDTKKSVNKNCKLIALESDVKAFATNLQNANSTKEKNKVATTMFKEKCYTINQIKRLSNLYSNDISKFSFFKLAQQSVVDMENFDKLQDELKDKNVVEEFIEFLKQL